jgi:hypothetical protein
MYYPPESNPLNCYVFHSVSNPTGFNASLLNRNPVKCNVLAPKRSPKGTNVSDLSRKPPVGNVRMEGLKRPSISFYPS